jgi:hypothetical protein
MSDNAIQLTPDEVKDQARAMFSEINSGWQYIAMDMDQTWCAYRFLPKAHPYNTHWSDGGNLIFLDDLPPYPGNWRESLVER